MGTPARLSLRHALALGLAHGPTELLPISSSAHTILIPFLAGWPYGELDPELRKSFEVALHAGTAAALLVDLRALESHPVVRAVLERLAGPRHSPATAGHPRTDSTAREAEATLAEAGSSTDLPARRALLVVALSFIPPAIVGYAFEQPLQRRFSGPSTIVTGLLLGGVAMALADARDAGGTRPLARAGAGDGLLLGLAQTCALLPGVSRGGAVLTAARARGFSRADSGTLARRTGLPVIVGAGALKTGRLLQRGAASGTPIPGGRALLVGGGASFLSTLAATRLLRRGRGTQPAAALWPYALYRGLLAACVGRRLREAHNKSG
ncbi:MAG TPA: undecaprenyl-diphosphate phosphatase [Solirubrobacteraceae bacterium]|jgi:undecaprenyl-diphosphatase